MKFNLVMNLTPVLSYFETEEKILTDQIRRHDEYFASWYADKFLKHFPEKERKKKEDMLTCIQAHIGRLKYVIEKLEEDE